MDGKELTCVLLASLGVLLGPELLEHVAQGSDEEAAGAACRVENRLALLWVEHLDGELHHASRGEVLAAVAAQIDTHQFLVSHSLGIDVGSSEVVLGQLRDNEGESSVGERDFLVSSEDAPILSLHLTEESLDALADLLAALVLELFLGTSPKTALPSLALFGPETLIVHFAEDDVEKLPESRILGHAFVAMDEIVAATEGHLQHFAVGHTGVSVRNDLFGADGLFRHWPVADGVAPSLKARSFLFEKEELEAVGPEPVLNGIDVAHNRFQLFKVLGGLLEVPDAYSILARIRLGPTDDSASQVLWSVLFAMVKDGDVDLLAPTDGEIVLHVFRRKPVLMNQGANHALADQLLRRFLDLSPRDVVEHVTRRDGVLSMSVLRCAHE